MFKKILSALLILGLLIAAVVPALADADVRYVNAKTAKVFAEPDTSSRVLTKFKGGRQLLIETTQSGWVSVLVEDSKMGGQTLGWIQSKNVSKSMPPKYCKHDWSEWKTVKKADCTHDGKKTRSCSICGKKEEKTIKAEGHDWSKWKVLEEATCIDAGRRTHTCRTCGAKETEQYYAEHTFGKWRTVKEPTCTEEGLRRHTCTVCDKTEKKTIDKLPHEMEWKVITPTTDHSAGVRAQVCRNCGYETNEQSFDPEGTLRRKDRGDKVQTMQQLLVEQGYLNAGGADGVFGGGTEKALMKYQQDRGLEPDGVCWPQTFNDLQHDFGPWRTEKEMTRTEDGVRVRTCTGCGFEQRETISAGAVFMKGSRGEDVRALQQIMSELGYNVGSFDGIYGGKLETGMANFAAANGLVVEKGKIRPADVDAAFNAWLEKKAANWKGEAELLSPIDPALTVTPSTEADDSGLVSYDWSLTNMGSKDAQFAALLLSFGDEPDFKSGVLVMKLDGSTLRKNSANSVTGSFSADGDWGEGNFNFAALVVDEATGNIWLSNVVTFDNAVAPTSKTVAPAQADVDVTNLPDGVYPVMFDPGDVFSGASGVFMNAVRVYETDVYASDDVKALKVGDTLIAGGDEIEVSAVESAGDSLTIHSADDREAIRLKAIDEDGETYAAYDADGKLICTELGTTTLVLDDAARFTDNSEYIDEPVSVGYDGVAAALADSVDPYFMPSNTSVRIEGGRVAEIVRTAAE